MFGERIQPPGRKAALLDLLLSQFQRMLKTVTAIVRHSHIFKNYSNFQRFPAPQGSGTSNTTASTPPKHEAFVESKNVGQMLILRLTVAGLS